MTIRPMPVAVCLAVLAVLVALGAEGFAVFRAWELEQRSAFNDGYFFSKALEHLAIAAAGAVIHFVAIWICLRVLTNRVGRAATYVLLAGIISAAVVELASMWAWATLHELPTRYIHWKAIDFESPARVGAMATPVALALLSAGWILLVAAIFRPKAVPLAGQVAP